jgi:hypothetical protein
MISRLAEDITGTELVRNREAKSLFQSEWRTDLFKFRAFKIAVKKLLDALEEPPAEQEYLTQEQREQMRRETVEQFGSEFTKMFDEIRKSPESYGAWTLGNLWARFTNSHLPFTENELRMMQRHPDFGRVMEREYYGFQKARKALELKPEEEDALKLLKSEKRKDKSR